MKQELTPVQAFQDVAQVVRQYKGTAEEHEYLTACLTLIAKTCQEVEAAKAPKELLKAVPDEAAKGV